MEHVKGKLRTLTRKVCGELMSVEIPNRPLWTVVKRADATPYVAMDVDRPALTGLRAGLSINLLRLPEYASLAEALEHDPEFSQGIIVDASGYLLKPEPTNITRALITNFLWRYLREGLELGWDEARFVETFNGN